jgi:hypothetical protein
MTSPSLPLPSAQSAHPRRFAEHDPFLAELRKICLGLPGAQEKISHGHPNFFTGKVFAIFGGLVKGDHAAADFARSVLFLPDTDERTALLGEPRFFHPAYYGPYGWVGLNFLAGRPDWAEVAELVEMSYRNTAGKKLIAELDARRPA